MHPENPRFHPAALLALGLLLPAFAARPAAPLEAAEWRAIHDQIAEHEAAHGRGDTPGHGLVRTTVLAGDYDGLPAQTAADGPAFGASVAVDGDWLAVGAPGTMVDGGTQFGLGRHGAVFMFQRDGGWRLRQRIARGWPGATSSCGSGVALRLPMLVVGCPGSGTQNDPDMPHGRMALYTLAKGDNWFQVATSNYFGASARCGTSVDVAHDSDSASTRIAVGCPGRNDDRGEVMLFAWNGANLTLDGRFAAAESVAGDRFGERVALYRGCALGICVQRLAVAAPYRTHGPALAGGSVYVFEGTGWSQTAVLTGPSPSQFALTWFGSGLAMTSSQLVIGARGGLTFDCGNVPRCGTVSRYQRVSGTWTLQEGGGAINAGGNPPGEQPGMEFGAAVAIGHDNWVAVAAPRADGWRATIPASQAQEIGMVELRRAGDGGWGVSWGDSQGELRPGAVLIGNNRDQGRFGSSVDFGARRLAVGYPYVGTPLGGRVGQVWVYEEDGLFADDFED